MFTLKSIVNSVINSDSVAVKVVGYSALAVIGLGADIIGTDTNKVEAATPATEEVADEDTVVEVIHDEDTVTEVIHDDDVVAEAIHEDSAEEVYDNSADREAEDELFEAAIKGTSDSFVVACENAVEAKQNGDGNVAVAMEEIAKYYLSYLQLNLGKEEKCIVVHNAREALAAFRAFGPTRTKWM